ncbi:hypothetical protein PR202_gb26288 [Eleusine coracana subsp. coracana]|uniref:Uncharacterized protein n=1 Tax=Eleusine coracana subsp. coracana TaxID=191504 RepID=A0AAV5FRT1_ELECO|nr:hypothetical protein PR202_gb26288 [Eleusine coracana subsp. coracana]
MDGASSYTTLSKQSSPLLLTVPDRTLLKWTFLLVTLYFGLGSLLSMYGCYQYAYKTRGNRSDLIGSSADHGTYVIAPTGEGAYDHAIKSPCYSNIHGDKEIAGFWGYLFQIMFQTNAGAVMITDLVFWFILYPFLARNDYEMNFILIGTHSINVVFIIGDVALNNMRFPWFRIAYFLLWTGIFVNVQWIIHANVSMWWPYPFLDLKFPAAPVWYLVVAVLHFPCYALFALVLRLKHSLLERWFPHTYVE